jgi:hypothetical protein
MFQPRWVKILNAHGVVSTPPASGTPDVHEQQLSHEVYMYFITTGVTSMQNVNVVTEISNKRLFMKKPVLATSLFSELF